MSFCVRKELRSIAPDIFVILVMLILINFVFFHFLTTLSRRKIENATQSRFKFSKIIVIVRCRVNCLILFLTFTCFWLPYNYPFSNWWFYRSYSRHYIIISQLRLNSNLLFSTCHFSHINKAVNFLLFLMLFFISILIIFLIWWNLLAFILQWFFGSFR